MRRTGKKTYISGKKRKKLIFKRIRFVFILGVLVCLAWNFNDITAGIWAKINIWPQTTQDDATKGVQESDITKVDSAVRGLSAEENEKRTAGIKNQLTEYLKSCKGKYGIYYYNLETMEEFGINQNVEFTAASTVKVPLNLYLCEKILAEQIDPQAKVTYKKADYEEGTGIIQYEEFGKSYTIQELSRLSIVNSDNVATNMLIRYLGLSALKQYMRQVGGVVVDEEKNISSPEDMGLYMKKVYELYQSGSEPGSTLMNNLMTTEFKDRIPALLPKTVKVAHKIGTQLAVVNDVGIVFAEKPYIISIMSTDVAEDEAVNVVANISKKVYDFANAGM